MKTIRVVIVPKKPSLLAAVGFWLLHRLNLLDENVVVARKEKLSVKAIETFSRTSTFCLFGNDLAHKLHRISRNLPDKEGKLAREIIYYATQCHVVKIVEEKLTRRRLSPKLFKHYIKCFYNPMTTTLGDFCNLLDNCLKIASSLDELLRALPEPSPASLEPLPIVMNDRNLHYTTIPTWDTFGKGGKITGVERVIFEEEKVRLLENRQIRIAACGPPGSGKSTSCATITSEIRVILDSLLSRPDFSNLKINVGSIDLDLGSPTLELINVGLGTDRERHKDLKTKWEIEKVYPALVQLESLTENIIFVDLPGKIDEITHLLLSTIDMALIITSDWQKVNEWRNLLKSFGIKNVAEARSYLLLEEDKPESLVKYYNSHYTTGRLVGVKRKLRNWDSYLEFLARALLFQYIPNHFLEEDKKSREVLNSVWREKP